MLVLYQKDGDTMTIRILPSNTEGVLLIMIVR